MYKKRLSQIIGEKEHHFERIDSTNDYASYLITKKNPIEGTVVSASYQTGGKGQYGRKWHSNAGDNLILSVILAPKILYVKDQFYLNIMTSLAVSGLVESLSHVQTNVKWPNDVYAEGRKIAGILIKNFVQKDKIRNCVVGIGVNINQTVFPEDTPNAISLKNILNRPVQLTEAKSILFIQLNDYYHQLGLNKALLRSKYLEKLLGKDLPSKFVVDGKKIEGIIRDIDPYGRLLVEINDRIQAFSHGEIHMEVN